MTMAPRLELRQSQALVMTPRLQQALRMLRMSNLELAEHVASLVESNPLLEAATPVARREAGSGRAGERATAVDLAAASVSLGEHLRAQVRLAHAGRAALAAAMAIIDELDGDGLLRVSMEELAARHRLDPADVAAGLALVQACEPAGVGARDLAECFRLQLEDRGLLDDRMRALLDGLGLLAAGRREELARRCGVSPADLGALVGVLRTLDARPGAGFGDVTVAAVVPDVFVRRSESGWHVELNTETLPRVLVDNQYALDLRVSDGSTLRYISECRTQAAWLVRSLEQRARTILSVASSVVAHQERFFAVGVSALKPLSRRALAEKLGLHESTVSRVTANKYLACERGTFDLRSFFSQSIPGRAGGEAVSAAAVQDRIRSLIQSEPAPRTLSDDRIVAILNGEGIDIARRTVAKYRDGMGIPSSVERRRLKAPSARL